MPRNSALIASWLTAVVIIFASSLSDLGRKSMTAIRKLNHGSW